ncbi:MAG: hypothetical protein PUF59_10665 [Lachnospiraceae bacterium]|nr:hypothetical protein [Lachnospiraceae bacterium]
MTEQKELTVRDTFKKMPVLFVLPLIIGVICYMQAGIRFLDALYYSVDLYLFDYYENEAVRLCMQEHLWTALGLNLMLLMAPLLTATAIILQFQESCQWLGAHLVSLLPKSTIIYGDTPKSRALCKNIRRSSLWTNAPLRSASRHIVMFGEDLKSLDVCRKYQSLLKKKDVYICVNEAGATSLKDIYEKDHEAGQMSIRFFNYNDTVARLFWKERKIWKSGKKVQKIAIVGFGSLGIRMLETALQLNLFHEEQCIEYYVFGDNGRYQHSHANLQLMNRDRVYYFPLDSREQWECMPQMDMIILTEVSGVAMVQAVLGCSACAEVYVYNPDDLGLKSYFSSGRLQVFGEYRSVLTEENITSNKLYKNAMELNAEYEKKVAEGNVDAQEAWNRLSGFLKSSNISAADFGEVLRSLAENKAGADLDLFARLEHIRWCRFHFLHYWKYGIPDCGQGKDEKKRIHSCLRPFDELDRDNQNKDYSSVKVLLELLETENEDQS